MNNDPFEYTMTAREASDVIGVSPGTLAQWRTHGRGPSYARRGRRVYYRAADVDALRRSREAGVVVNGPST